MLRIATDCSGGIESPILALRELGYKFEHKWSCEIDKNCQKNIKINYNPEIFYEDITKRNNDLLPDIDLYVSGFPCQPFSIAGSNKGFSDDRGNIFFNCLDVIQKKKPEMFILENVQGLLSHNNGNTFKTIKDELNQLSDYIIDYRILNTKDYGLPQNRKRIYIIGKLNGNVLFPEKCEMRPISEFVDYSDNRKYITKDKTMIERIKTHQDNIFAAASSKLCKQNPNYCPCLTAKSNIYNIKMSRYINSNEARWLQGIPDNFVNVCCETQFKKQIGNSMSVNVLSKLLELNLNDRYKA